ncbi:MAG: 30S ribosomal protein S6 [Parvularculaceae bacterium]
MPLYEHVFMARQDISPAQVESLTEELQGIIKDNGGKIAKSEYWGLRTLQYKIAKNRKGHYSLMNIEAEPAAMAELERQMKINEDILRFLTIRVDEHNTDPSPVLSRRDRGDRPDRGDRGRGDRDRGDRGDRGDRDNRGPRS